MDHPTYDEARWQMAQRDGQYAKIDLIKRYRNETGLGLKEAKDVVDQVETELRGEPLTMESVWAAIIAKDATLRARAEEHRKQRALEAAAGEMAALLWEILGDDERDLASVDPTRRPRLEHRIGQIRSVLARTEPD